MKAAGSREVAGTQRVPGRAMDWKSGDLRQMSTRNIIQATFDEFGKSLCGSKKSGSWYVTGPDAIAVLNLQKSQYGPRYYCESQR